MNTRLVYFSSPVQAVLGDVSKWVPMSSDRVLELNYGQTEIVATLTGHMDETVTMSVLIDGVVMEADCSLISSNCVLYADQPEN